jgi:hypothetical protein
MTYQLTQGDTILRLADNAFIPLDPANTDYQAYLAWLDEGNTPLPLNGQEDTVLVRARNEDGTYAGDDPLTPDANEAYVEVPLSEA